MVKLRQNLKIFNYRPLVLVFLSLISGILTAVFCDKYTLIVIFTAIACVGIIIFYSIIHKSFKYILITFLTFCIGFGGYNLFMYNAMHTSNNFTNSIMQGEVIKVTNRGYYLDVVLTDIVAENEKIDYNVLLKYNNAKQVGYIDLNEGDIIEFSVVSQNPINYINNDQLPNLYVINDNIGALVTSNEVKIIGQHNTIRLTLLNRLRNNLRYGLDNFNGEMIYSAMFGDKDEFNTQLRESYNTAGLAHLLAVSGLHVGLIVGIIYLILKRLKVKDWIRVLILGLLLLGYGYICNFSYSVVRASIMALILLISSLFYSEYDLLSSICLAGCIVLILNPTALFDLGALLTFACVFGICLLYPLFSRLLSKFKIKNSITDSMAISISIFISIAAIMAYFFNNLQPVSILANIIFIPIFSILFTICFIVAIISLIIPYISYTLILVNPVLSWFNWLVTWVASISIGIPTIDVNYLTILLWFTFISFVSHYYLKLYSTKLTLCSLIFLIISVQVYCIQ